MGKVAAGNLHVRVVSRRLVKAFDTSIKPHVLALSNIDILYRAFPAIQLCIYRKPPASGFDAVVATFKATLPSFLNHFFPFAGRVVTDPRTGLPEVHCNNEGAELVVGEADVALASLHFGSMGDSLAKIPVACGGDNVALSVQLVSFACGGFSVAWSTKHMLMDGYSICMAVGMWSELARSGVLAAGAAMRHDRSVFRPRVPPSYSSSLAEAYAPLRGNRLINVLTSDQSFVERLYYVEARGIQRLQALASRDGGSPTTRVEAVSAYLWKVLAAVVGASDASCRMGWWVDGRRRLTAPEYRASLQHNYIGCVTTFTAREARVEDIQGKTLSDVASMVRETITARSYDEHFQELVDWVEDHKDETYAEAATIGLGSPTVGVTSLAAFPADTDFGFGEAALAMPVSPCGRLCSGYVQLIAQPGGDGSWFVSALVWPQLADALESDVQGVFKLVTAEYLGLTAAADAAKNVRFSRL